MIKNVVICGLGAIGTIYALKLKQVTNLRVLLDEKRLESYKSSPIIFNGGKTDFEYVLPSKKDFKADLIIIATKNSGLDEAVGNIKNFIKEDTIILSLLNGISSEETIAQKYGEKHVIPSYFVGHTSSRNGRNIVFDGVGEIVFGSKTKKDKRVSLIKELFDKADINYTIPDDIDYAVWKKFLVNVGTNQASAVLRGTYELFQTSEKALDIAKSLMREAQSIAKAKGIQNTDKMFEEALEIINSMLPETKSSMLQDVENKRKTEVEIFAKKVMVEGKKYSVETPCNEMFYKLISAIDDGRTID